MASADEYSAYVEQCIALAAKELHPGDRVRLLQMAKAWRDLAEKLEASQNNPAAKPLPVALKALVAHRGALGAGIVADIVLRPPVEVTIAAAIVNTAPATNPFSMSTP